MTEQNRVQEMYIRGIKAPIHHDRLHLYYGSEPRALGYTDHGHILRFALKKEKGPCHLIISGPPGVQTIRTTLPGAQFCARLGWYVSCISI